MSATCPNNKSGIGTDELCSCVELKKCPFCGGAAHLIDKAATHDWQQTQYDIGCKTEGCYLEWGADWFFDTAQEAADAWNRRVAQTDNAAEGGNDYKLPG